MKYNRTELADNTGFSTVTDSKFKTNSLTIQFMTELGSDAADNAVGVSVLTTSTKKYNTLAKLSRRLSELYGATLSSSAKKVGDIQVLTVYASWINNRYALENEDITAEMLDIICESIFAPNAENGCFDADSFEIAKKEILDHIESEINNKRGYAISRASETAFKGEPAQCACYGNKETAEAVTAASSYEAYRRLILNAAIEIFYVAPEENPLIEKRVGKELAKLDRKAVKCEFLKPSPVKQQPERVSDTLDVSQCKMVMSFKTDCRDECAVKLLSLIFGGTPVSKLFMNVREKLSLCYYCACRTIASKSALMVDCGIERENIEKAEKEILFQLDEIRNGNFTDEEVESAMLAIENALSAVGDTHSSYVSWYFDCICFGTVLTPEQKYELYKAVTRESIIKAAKETTLDSVYLMLNKEADQ